MRVVLQLEAITFQCQTELSVRPPQIRGWAASNPPDTRSEVDVFTGERAHHAGFARSGRVFCMSAASFLRFAELLKVDGPGRRL